VRSFAIATVACAALGATACGGDDDVVSTIPDNDAGKTSSSSSSSGGSSSSSGGSSSSSGAPDGGSAVPVADFAITALDLGSGDCGGAAVTKTLAVQNKGGGSLTVNLATTGGPFTVSPATLTVAPGATQSITISAAVPTASTAGTSISGLLTVTTNDPKNKTASVPLSVTPQGATLVFDTGSATGADFGTQKLGAPAANKTLTLKNEGNKAATFEFSNPADTQFSLTTSPASPANLAAGATVTVTASFTPSKLTESTSVSNLTVTGAVCGTSVTKIDFSGQGVVGNVSGFPSSDLDFGLSPCGGSALAAKSFTLKNTGPADVKLTSIGFAATKGYSVDQSNGAVIPAGGELVVNVTPPAIPFPSAVPGDYSDTLTIETDVPGDSAHQIPVTVAAKGAILAFDTSATANFGTFGPVPTNTTASHDFALINQGNAAASVTASAGTGDFGVTPTTFNVAPSASQALKATFTPTKPGPQTGNLGVSATGLCQALPPSLKLSGDGQSGGIALSSSSVAFETACNTTADPKTFTITNTGNQPMTWTATQQNGAASEFTLSSTGSTVAAGDFVTITVTPKAIPQYPASIDPASYADTVTITTDISGDVEHKVSLSEKPIGAVLSFEPSTIQFGGVPINTTSDPQSFVVKNSGNPGSDASLTLASDNAAFVVQTTTGTSLAGGSLESALTFAPGNSATAQTGKVSVTTTSPICAPLPSALAADGTGTAGQVVFNPSTVNFGNVNCGGTAAPKTVTFSNPGNQDYKITNLALEKGTYFTVSMSPVDGIVPKNNGGTVVVTLTPSAIPQTVPSVPATATYSDQLTITTNAANDTPHSIAVNMGARGVILKPIASKSWTFGTVNYGSTGYYQVGLRNDGNVPVTVSLSNVTLPVFSMNPTTIPASGGAVLSGMFTPDSSSQTYADTGSLTVPDDTVFCQPQPNYDLTLTGQGGSGATLTISGNLSFPSVECNAPANQPLTVTIKNSGNTALPYTAGFDVGTWYTITSGASGSVPANGTATVTVQPKQITTSQGAYSGTSTYADRLELVINSVAYNVPISQNAKGSDIYGGWDTQVYWYYGYTWGGYICAQNNGNYSATMSSTINDPSFMSTVTLNLPTNSGGQCARHNWTYPQATSGCYQHIADFNAVVSTTGVVCHTDFPPSYTLSAYACD
jgi:hypothetical protein